MAEVVYERCGYSRDPLQGAEHVLLCRSSFSQTQDRRRRQALWSVALIASALIFPTPKAGATPNFQADPAEVQFLPQQRPAELNDTGLAFKNNGLPFPGK